MSDRPSQFLTDRLTRRTFLRGGVCLAGAALLGVVPGIASQASSGEKEEALGLAYWDGNRLIDAADLPDGDRGLCASGLRASIESYSGSDQNLRGLSVLYAIGPQVAPFHAWTATRHGSKTSTFTAPVSAEHGLVLNVEHKGSAQARSETLCHLSVGDTRGQAKLRPGTYVLTARATNWTRYSFDPSAEGDNAPLTTGGVAVDFDYLVINIAAA